MSLPGPQLPLGLRLSREPLLEEFVPGPNAEALAAVTACAEGRGETYLYLWGNPGSGRTHLLLGACRAAARREARPLYLDLSNVRDLDAQLLQDLEQLDLVALDNLQAIAGDLPWQRALFDMFNRLRESGARLLASGDKAAANLPLTLPDLASRLAWGPGYRLRPLDDKARLELLQRSAQARGMRLPPGVARYILHRCPRDLGSLEALLDLLEQATLAAQKSPSIPLTRALLEDIEPFPGQG